MSKQRKSDPCDVARLPSGRTAPAAVIVCERSPLWAVALRRELELVESTLRVHETRGVAGCWDELARRPASFVVVELTAANAPRLLEQLGRLEGDFPLARVAVVAERQWRACGSAVCQAGAVYFTTSLRQSDRLAGMARRHLARAPQPRRSAAERVQARLPWKSVARQCTER